MSHYVFMLVFLFFLCPIPSQLALPPKAVNPKRIKQMKQALSWMYFRKNGKLATEQELEPLSEALKDHYINSKYYRTMIIASSRGVIPKLTLKENDPCDPSYTSEYRDSFYSSVTDFQLKKLIFRSYDKRGDASLQFCDYRQGLVCNNQTNKCECPVGSTMEPISQGSNKTACLLQKNQVCTLIDLDHDPNSNYGALKRNLPVMILNFLEKPLSCAVGTQCRFKSNNPTTPFCYEVNAGPWDKGRWDLSLGEECTLGLHVDNRQCKQRDIATSFDGYTCFNFGPRSQPKIPGVGICAHEMGSYVFTNYKSWDINKGDQWELQMIGFVSPATTPLRGTNLYDYYKNYLNKLEGYLANWNGLSSMAPNAGDRCNIEKTEKLLELWKFYKNLEETPPPGKHYGATEAELKTKFEEAEMLTVDVKKKICRAFTMVFRNSEVYHALRCVRNTTDRDGNDGRCEVIPKSEDVTYSWAETFLQYRTKWSRINYAQYYQESNFRKDIYEPELECDPKLGHPPGSVGAPNSTDSDVLEGGFCPPDRVCHEDYKDFWEIYDKDCKFKTAKPKLYRNCQDTSEKRRYETCEYRQLNDLIQQELDSVSSYSGLLRGDACKHDLETKLRGWMKEYSAAWILGNKYKILIELRNLNNGGTRLCDRTKLLECTSSGICECLPGTQPREVILNGGTTVYSDFCYLTSGNCFKYSDDGIRLIYQGISGIETDEINRHYKEREGEGRWYSCENSNWCVFTKKESDGKYLCTTNNTGMTGHDGSLPVTTTTTTSTTTTTRRTTITTTRRRRTTTSRRDESNLVCQGKNCGWQDAGEHIMKFMWP